MTRVVQLYQVDSGSPLLDYLKRRGVPRDQWAVAWIAANWCGLEIPDEVTGEILSEVVPVEIRSEIELRFMKRAGSVQ
jgi:hypothetical protein